MLKALLIVCLFFGMISLIVLGGKRQEWIYLLLILSLVFSVGTDFLKREVSFEVAGDGASATYEAFPESQALHSAVASHVRAMTGEYPASVESDLEVVGEKLKLTYIRVVIHTGDEKEVERALCQAFSFRGFSVFREPEKSDEGFGLAP